MKITLLNTSDSVGGAAVACRRLHQSLLQEKINSDFLVQDMHSGIPHIINVTEGPFSQKRALFRLLYEKSILLFKEKSAENRFAFSLADSGINILKKYDFTSSSVIHLHWVQQGFLSLKGLENLFSLNKPIVWTLHDMWAFTGGCHHSRGCERYTESCHDCPYLKYPGKNDAAAKIWKRKNSFYENANLTIVCPSKWLAERAESSSLFAGKKVLAIPNPIDTTVFCHRDKSESRRSLKLPAKKYIIGFAALNTSAYYKGHTYLLEALRLFSQKYPDFTKDIGVLMLGKAKPGIDYNLPFEVFTPGYIFDESRLIDCYNALDLFMLPSLEENLPNTIVEAMACGVPAVAFDVGGIPEIIDHQINGYVAGYKSVEGLAEGIFMLLNDPENYRQISIAARQKVLNTFDRKVVAPQFISLYQQLSSTK